MKENNLKIFKKVEENLRTALYSDYSRNLPASVMYELERAYQDETGTNGLVFTSVNCNTCLLRGLKTIAGWYFKELERQREREAQRESETKISTKKVVKKTNGIQKKK